MPKTNKMTAGNLYNFLPVILKIKRFIKIDTSYCDLSELCIAICLLIACLSFSEDLTCIAPIKIRSFIHMNSNKPAYNLFQHFYSLILLLFLTHVNNN